MRARWAEPAGRGAVVLTAALAEESGDDPRSPSASAARASDGRWVLTGVKTAVPAAPGADLFLVPVTGPDGVLVFLVAPSDDGVRVEAQSLTDVASAGRVVLDEVSSLDEDRVLRASARTSRAGWWRGPPWGCARRRSGSSSGRWR